MKEDKVIGIILTIFSALMYYKTLEFPPAMFGTLGAGFFPQILFTLLALAGAALTISGFLRDRKRRDTEKTDKRTSTGIQLGNRLKQSLHYYSHVIISFFLFFCYMFMPILMWILGPRNRRAIPVTIIVSFGTTFIIYLAFLKFLHVFLPEGSLF